MKSFVCSLRMCFPHKFWVKELQGFRNQHKMNNSVKCREKFIVERVYPPVGYIYDDQVNHCCFVSSSSRSDALSVHNWLAWHICVDGGLIRYGCRNYMGDYNYPQGRCDSIVFDNKNLWFVEMKMDTTTSLDSQLWRDLKNGMGQLKDFILNLRIKMAAKHTPLHRYYSVTHQNCTVCMKRYPIMNTSRNNHLEAFRLATGIKLRQLNSIP